MADDDATDRATVDPTRHVRRVMELIAMHRTVVLIVLGALVLGFALWAMYAAGARHAATAMRIEALDASRGMIADSVAQAKRARDSVAKENDTLHRENAELHARNDSLARRVAESKTAAALVRAQLVIVNDTATVTTDSGPVRIQIPSVLAEQIGRERASMDFAYHALEQHRDSLALENDGLRKETAGLRVEVALDSVETKRLRQLNDSASAEIDLLKRAHTPRLTFTEGLIGGAATVLTLLAVF